MRDVKFSLFGISRLDKISPTKLNTLAPRYPNREGEGMASSPQDRYRNIKVLQRGEMLHRLSSRQTTAKITSSL
jgi:hypothetical protein